MKKIILLIFLFLLSNHINCVFFKASLKDVKKDVQNTTGETEFAKTPYKITITYYTIKKGDYHAEVIIEQDERKNYLEVHFMAYKKKKKENTNSEHTFLLPIFHCFKNNKTWLDEKNCSSFFYAKKLLACAIQKDSPKKIFSSSKLKYSDVMIKTFK